ncbi:hypothetical protein EDB85DRAFT_1901945 [Lactarius pseudohatsudake]|nr:hypothetical protein EDB85DRAFT_1901945 [Lactarius pseudohatsudake]
MCHNLPVGSSSSMLPGLVITACVGGNYIGFAPWARPLGLFCQCDEVRGSGTAKHPNGVREGGSSKGLLRDFCGRALDGHLAIWKNHNSYILCVQTDSEHDSDGMKSNSLEGEDKYVDGNGNRNVDMDMDRNACVKNGMGKMAEWDEAKGGAAALVKSDNWRGRWKRAKLRQDPTLLESDTLPDTVWCKITGCKTKWYCVCGASIPAKPGLDL